jgi:hypothetical protein
MMMQMATWAHLATIQQHAQDLKVKDQSQTNSFCNRPCTEKNKYPYEQAI